VKQHRVSSPAPLPSALSTNKAYNIKQSLFIFSSSFKSVSIAKKKNPALAGFFHIKKDSGYAVAVFLAAKSA
jgi:hypothetical protein